MSWILTHTGQRFDLHEPDADLIDPRDISHALANICRFNGHTREFYSVAQHCCMVADLVADEYKLAGLLHDAPQAYIGDMVRPLKQWLLQYLDVQDWLWERICTRFDLDTELPEPVRQANLTALATERRDFMPHDTAIWNCLVGVEPLPERIRPWPAIEARTTYHQRLMDQLAIDHRRKAGSAIAEAYAMPAPALIRDEVRIDAQQTDSCCGAASITAFSSAAADVPLPHEKLREAQSHEATLNALNRPHAQPVVGYTQSVGTQQQERPDGN
jgi:hypothetical protein